MHDQQGQILDANSAACRQLGYSRDELLGMTTSQIDVPEFAAGFQERLRRQLQQGTLNCEGLHRTKSGRIIPVEVTTSTIQFDNQVAVLAILPRHHRAESPGAYATRICHGADAERTGNGGQEPGVSES